MNERFIDVLFSKIISDNPHHAGLTDEKRVSRAREALFGEWPAKGRLPLKDEVTIFHILTEQRKGELDPLRKALRPNNPEFQTPEWDAEFKREK